MSQHLHFMGIGGISMSGLARHHKASGDRVTGCDVADSATLETLREIGIPVEVGHHVDHLDGVDILVISAAVAMNEPEVLEAQRRGIPVLKRMDLLRNLLAQHQGLGVTGTHGKSSTSGMLATILLHADQDPSVQLGASLPAIGGVMRHGDGPHLVAEVDESDPGFANLACHVAIVTNLEDDHIAGEHDERRTYHASLADLEAATRSFAHNAEILVSCADWPALDELLSDHPQRVTYGEAEHATYRIEQLRLDGEGTTFRFTGPDASTEVTLQVPGRFNALNAAGAMAAAHTVGIDLAKGAEALATYRGVGRRWDRWGEVRGAPIIDDYAHHPTEVAATLGAARETGRRVRAVLQPHRWVRTARHWPALADAAALADEVLVVDVYGAGETPIPGISSQLIVERLLASGANARLTDLPHAAQYLADTLEPNDLILTLGAGDVWRVAAALVGAPEAHLDLVDRETPQ